MSTGGKKPDIPVIIYAGELSRLLESGMSYEDASVAADQIELFPKYFPNKLISQHHLDKLLSER
ncbi:hypothetical protein DAPPUDRAFT_245999 [Daphnia pulex]|uniref:Uncharacterized protein n=1 Tax=Daphnia pulex TaxID=6669 RepID=E9GPF8_DAPPU|nr:hypothetical protein DAPPUDRAFT_245999 [Daphnia pulex]|eukprot:EFX78688.1 hypothetical protein DAPPUDRAFT_245999 [Daphnia pulex]